MSLLSARVIVPILHLRFSQWLGVRAIVKCIPIISTQVGVHRDTFLEYSAELLGSRTLLILVHDGQVDGIQDERLHGRAYCLELLEKFL